MNSDVTESLMTTAEAARFLGIARITLEHWRAEKKYAIPFVRLGANVRYRRADLEEFIRSRTTTA